MHETSTRSPGSSDADAARRPPRPCRPPRGRGPCPARTSGTSPLRMCRSVPQIVDAVDADDRVAGVDDRRVVDAVPAALLGAVVDEGLHGVLPSGAVVAGRRRAGDEVHAVRALERQARRGAGRHVDDECGVLPAARPGRRRCRRASPPTSPSRTSSAPGGSSASSRHIGELPSQQPPDWWNTSGPCVCASARIVAAACGVAVTRGRAHARPRRTRARSGRS